jgi:hypothetical protein
MNGINQTNPTNIKNEIDNRLRLRLRLKEEIRECSKIPGNYGWVRFDRGWEMPYIFSYRLMR